METQIKSLESELKVLKQSEDQLTKKYSTLEEKIEKERTWIADQIEGLIDQAKSGSLETEHTNRADCKGLKAQLQKKDDEIEQLRTQLRNSSM